jgi:hypothetical protein
MLVYQRVIDSNSMIFEANQKLDSIGLTQRLELAEAGGFATLIRYIKSWKKNYEMAETS